MTWARRERSCGAIGPSLRVSRTPCPAVAGRGGANRSSPTGGAAYGTPRKTAMSFSWAPRIWPAVVRTRSSSVAVIVMVTSSLLPLREAPLERHDHQPFAENEDQHDGEAGGK